MVCKKYGTGIRHTIAGWYCNGCEKYFTLKELEQMKYQQRLDKVLAKFNQFEDGYYEYNIKAQTSNKRDYTIATMVYYNSQFNFGDNSKPISLDTVEHLIKDIEAQDE